MLILGAAGLGLAEVAAERIAPSSVVLFTDTLVSPKVVVVVRVSSTFTTFNCNVEQWNFG